LSNSCQQIAKKLQKVVKKCQKAVKKLTKNADKDELIDGRILSPDVAPGKNLQFLK
jgi:hypothetical protein